MENRAASPEPGARPTLAIRIGSFKLTGATAVVALVTLIAVPIAGATLPGAQLERRNRAEGRSRAGALGAVPAGATPDLYRDARDVRRHGSGLGRAARAGRDAGVGLAYARKIRLEEKSLREIFGADYDAYRRKSWALIPGLV